MGISTQRLVVVTLLIDILLVLTGAFLLGTNGQADTQNTLESYNNITKQYITASQDTNPDTSTIQLDKIYGDTKAGGLGIFTILTGGINYDKGTVPAEEASYPYVAWLTIGWALLVGIINAILVFEVYLIIVNRKTGG